MQRIVMWLGLWLLVTQAAWAFEDRFDRPEKTAWSSTAPLSIPLEVRKKHFDKGNLVPNPSFEKRTAAATAPASTQNGLRLAGWTRMGRSVEWVHSDADRYFPDEVHTGRRAVRITRGRAAEVDAAEGVMSDYIPVVPGNYDFTVAVRLKDVAGNRNRMGARLDDAVAFKVLFFDAHKKPLDPKAMNPVGGGFIDNSNKSYPFANYWRIDDFPWNRISPRTYNYPFSEGDLPDKTRFVRLFIGLKGSGIMWFDDVDFRYSKWNFSALERLAPYFDQPLEIEQSLLPTPRHIRVRAEIATDGDGLSGAAAPVIVLPENPEPADLAASRLLRERLDAAMDRGARQTQGPPGRTRIVSGSLDLFSEPRPRLVFSIGNTRLLQEPGGQQPVESPPDHAQGYSIESRAIGGCRVVFLNGRTSIGNFYAAATAVQLLAEDRPVFHDAEVRDHPDFNGRSFVLPSWKETTELKDSIEHLAVMAAWKLNKVYVGFQGRTPDWHRPSPAFREGTAAIGAACRESGVLDLALMINPYAHFEFMPPAETLSAESRYTWTHADPRSMEMLQNVFRIGLDAGAATIMLMSDDYVPHEGKNRLNYSLYTPEDKQRFVNLQNAQAHVVNGLKHWLDRDFPGTRLEFCPPWYNNEFIDRSEGRAEIYLRELAAQIPADVAVIWTGPTVRSLSIDMADLERYSALIGRRPMIWDNTLYARNLETTVYGGYTAHYPGKVRMCNLFEPFDGPRPPDFHALNDGGHMYTNGAAGSDIFRIKYATIADYEWNSAAYDPERSLWKVLVRNYGAACARQLLRFNHAYYGLYDACMRLERDGAAGGRAARAGERFLREMAGCLSAVAGRLGENHRLVKELSEYRDRQMKRFETLRPADARGVLRRP
jgi:hypothetical protein